MVVFHRGAMWPHRGHLTASGGISGYSPGTERAETKEEPPDREFFSSVSRVLREKTPLYSQSHTGSKSRSYLPNWTTLGLNFPL